MHLYLASFTKCSCVKNNYTPYYFDIASSDESFCDTNASADNSTSSVENDDSSSNAASSDKDE